MGISQETIGDHMKLLLSQPLLSFSRQHKKKEKARYIELPLDELEKRYDPQWLKDHITSRSELSLSIRNEILVQMIFVIIRFQPLHTFVSMMRSARATPSARSREPTEKMLQSVWQDWGHTVGRGQHWLWTAWDSWDFWQQSWATGFCRHYHNQDGPTASWTWQLVSTEAEENSKAESKTTIDRRRTKEERFWEGDGIDTHFKYCFVLIFDISDIPWSSLLFPWFSIAALRFVPAAPCRIQLRITTLANKARNAATNLSNTGIPHQEAR